MKTKDMTTNNKLTAQKSAIKESKQLYSGVIYVNGNSHLNWFMTDTQKTSESLYAYSNGVVIWSKY
jgi:hypothetical protein